ncbi:MAG: thiopurine S-methyltransferase [Pseudomonadota bacterium]
MSFRAWNERWENGRIGFHEPEVNTFLQAHWNAIEPGERVFVPLCGKSLDLTWLAERGHDVIGVEFVEAAVVQFFEEAGWEPTITTVSGGRCYRYGAITLYAADLFALDAAAIGRCDCLYDRAALVALPAHQRPAYAAAVLNFLNPSARGLVVTLAYEQARMDGPPYAVLDDELIELFGASVQWQRLHSDPAAIARNPKFRERGVDRLEEIVWSLQRRPIIG